MTSGHYTVRLSLTDGLCKLVGGRQCAARVVRCLSTTMIVTSLIAVAMLASVVHADDGDGDEMRSAPNLLSLSGAVHLVVAEGTLGNYTIDSNVHNLSGALLMFEPVSPYILSPMKRTRRKASELRTSPISRLARLWLGDDAQNSCNIILQQNRIFPIAGNSVEVQHHSAREVGHVCISLDGVHYMPTRITYETLPIRLNHFAHTLSSKSIQNINLDVESESTFDNRERYELGIVITMNGTLVLDVTQNAYTIINNTNALTADETANLIYVESSLTNMRLSSRRDCSVEAVYLLGENIEITRTTLQLEAENGVRDHQAEYSVVINNASQMYPQNFNVSQYNSDVNRYYVCVSVERHGADARTVSTDDVNNSDAYNDFHHYRSSDTPDMALLEQVMNRRLYTLDRSMDINGAAIRTYTVVPTLSAYVLPSGLLVTRD